MQKKTNLVNNSPSFVPSGKKKKWSGCKKDKKQGNKDKKLLPQAKTVEVKKNGIVLRKMTVRRKTYFPGKRNVTYQSAETENMKMRKNKKQTFSLFDCTCEFLNKRILYIC